MKTQEELTNIVAKNITHYRKINRWTQLELAQKISYSDKAVSKWERAESLPDVYILMLLSEIFGVKVNDLLEEKSVNEIINDKKEKQKSFLYNKIIIAILSSALVMFIAVVVFAILQMIFPNEKHFWLSFIYALPFIAIIWIVFAKLYWKPWVRFVAITALNWFISLAIFTTASTFSSNNFLWLLFIISAAFQVLIIFWYLRKKKK